MDAFAGRISGLFRDPSFEQPPKPCFPSFTVSFAQPPSAWQPPLRRLAFLPPWINCLGLAALLLAAGCSHAPPSPRTARATAWFPPADVARLATRPGVDFIPGLRGCQQTTDYSCGPAALLSVARFYHLPGITADAATELRIAREAGTRFPPGLPPGGKLGTKPEEMVAWLHTNGFEAKLEFENPPRQDGAALRRLRENIRQGIPTLVAWIDLGGHWAVAVGYDDRQNDDPWDDVLILADPYDRYDGVGDGYTFVNANRFYWMWFDAHHFDRETWRVMISVKPKAPLPHAAQHGR